MAGTVTLALINVSHLPAKARANFLRVLDPVEALRTVEYDGRDGALPPPDGPGFDCALITGSIDSVNDDLAYVDRLREWVRATDRPLLGVCFGHQLIASTYGGTVERMASPELGYRRITVDVPTDPLFEGLPATVTGFTCHFDTVVEPPPPATVLASNEAGVQALRMGRTASVQFHPEIGAEYGRWLVGDMAVSRRVKEEAYATITPANVEAAGLTGRVITNFLREIR